MAKYTPPTGTTAAEAALTRMKAAGVDVLFANPGTDFPSIIEAYAKSGQGEALPAPVICPHETLTVGMAHGYYLMTGKPAAVMVHVNVGLANAVMGLINAASENIPVVMCSGRTPLTEADRFGARSSPIHWGQEMRDQGAMVREIVKWDYELRYPEQAATAVDRAVAIAQSEPKGPVYLSLPREVLAEPAPAVTPAPAPQRLALSAADPLLVAEAAALIAGAKAPLLITQSPDHSPEGVAALARLAEAAAIPVVEYWATRMALPTDHPCHAGRDPHALVAKADVIIVANAMVPWIIETAQPPAGCKIIAIGPDALYQNLPMRGFPIDLMLTGGLTPTLAALGAAVAAQSPGEEVLAPRRAALQAMREAQAAAAKTRSSTAQVPMTPAFVSRCLSEAADENTVFFNELGVDPAVMEFTGTGQFFSTPLSGGLGWGLTAALGAQLGARDKQVIATVGDGSYTFANPVACHQTAQALGLPLLTVVFNNGIWNAVRRSTLYMYPEGEAARANVMPITALEGAPDYAAVARAHGAHAERVQDGADLPAAIQRALAATRAGQQALLEVFVGI